MLTLALLATVAVLRFLSDRSRRHQQSLLERWQPVFIHIVEGLPVKLPSIAGTDRETVLYLWIHFTESVRGNARDRLRDTASALNMGNIAMALLESGRERRQMMGIVTLGRMKFPAAWPHILQRLDHGNPLLSLLAARSLLQIDPQSAIPPVLAAIRHREDWPAAKVIAMFRDIPPELLPTPLMNAIEASGPAATMRLIRLLEVLPATDTWPVLAPLLNDNQPIEVIAGALKMCRDPRALDPARLLATHDSWIVRAQAASTLGKIGTDEDRYRLLAMLGDPEWWVRYRAGISLTKMPSVTREKLLSMLDRLTDKFAIDILRQVISENHEEHET